MRIVFALSLSLACVAPAVAQVQPFNSPVAIADRHRFEIDRLRLQSEQRDAFARQQQQNTRLTLLELQAARRPEPIQPESYRTLRTPDQERALREAAAGRNRATVEDVTQIDGWLDRPRQ